MCEPFNNVEYLMVTEYFLAHILPGICLCFMMLVNCDGKVLAIALLTLAQGINGASVLTNMRNSQDLAPNFAGTLYGTINSFSGMTGVFTPFISAALINAYVTRRSQFFDELILKNLILGRTYGIQISVSNWRNGLYCEWYNIYHFWICRRATLE